MAEPRPLRPNDPTEVGGYRLTGRVGEGAQGTVYLGESDDGERVAVKVLRAEIEGDERARTLFDRELAAARRVAPFCTARVFAAEAGGEAPYIVSEYIDGPSLRELVAGRGPMPEPELRRLAIGTATALAAIHEAGVVHRDFKPANVLLGPDGPKVIDFGVARPLEATSATLTGAVGTPAYMAPEQVSGAAGGAPLDMFAWGCTMAYAANGTPPFGVDTVPAIMHRVLYAPPALGVLSGELGALVAASLEKDPARRPTALQVLTRLLGTGPDGNLLAEGTSAAATLTAATLPPPAPFAPPATMPGPVPPPFQTVPAAPPKGNKALLIVGAVAGVVLLAAATTTAALLLKDDGGKPSARHVTGAAVTPATTGARGAGGGRCTYLAPSSGGNVKDVGTPPPVAQATGTVHAAMKTNLGTLNLDLDAAKAPCTVNSVMYLAGKKYFDGTHCHRLTTDASLKVLQCGDPSGTGSGGPSYRFPDENLGEAAYTRGTVAMANAGPDTNGSQFFILYGDTTSLPKSYTVFGHVTSGMGIVDKVAQAGAEPAQDGTPKLKVTIERFTTSNA
ncbi:protein kinase domain-containing protein [Actinomadura opuntiae]|uniref:protein kinase domain-containing protein n=1 Tax=Actinomadura sp. OS1-43 TaxID=604315 RepID=UPI00255B0E41|nr:peptidylprolyl isomerase [Actinomadura sp. OS1-43]MDL4818276.1 peptidylprolyl isomerase [Actinomadura sp. OS1-43]